MIELCHDQLLELVGRLALEGLDARLGAHLQASTFARSCNRRKLMFSAARESLGI